MAKGFGELAKVRGIIFYKLSPFEQRAFAGVVKKGFPNTIRRISENFWRVAPSFIASWIIFNLVEKRAEELKRKNPDDFACDV